MASTPPSQILDEDRIASPLSPSKQPKKPLVKTPAAPPSPMDPTVATLADPFQSIPLPPGTPNDPLAAFKVPEASKPFFMSLSTARDSSSEAVESAGAVLKRPPPIPGEDVDPSPKSTNPRRKSDPVGTGPTEGRWTCMTPAASSGGTDNSTPVGSSPFDSSFATSSDNSKRRSADEGQQSFDTSSVNRSDSGIFVVAAGSGSGGTPDLSLNSRASSPENSFNSIALTSYPSSGGFASGIFATPGTPFMAVPLNTLAKESAVPQYPSSVIVGSQSPDTALETPIRSLSSRFGGDAFFPRSSVSRANAVDYPRVRSSSIPPHAGSVAPFVPSALGGPPTVPPSPTEHHKTPSNAAYSPMRHRDSFGASTGAGRTVDLLISSLTLRIENLEATVARQEQDMADMRSRLLQATVAPSAVSLPSVVPAGPSFKQVAPRDRQTSQAYTQAPLSPNQSLSAVPAVASSSVVQQQQPIHLSGTLRGANPNRDGVVLPARIENSFATGSSGAATAPGVTAGATGARVRLPSSSDYTLAGSMHADPALKPATTSTTTPAVLQPVQTQPVPSHARVYTHSSAVGNRSGQAVNYRSLMANDVDCDYAHFVERIVTHNDQQASIFLQHKIKQSAAAEADLAQSQGQSMDGSAAGEEAATTTTATGAGARAEITRLVVESALELMTNRFGNFLVSRVIEHATPHERLGLAERVRGNIALLACDTFATHCLQNMVDADVSTTVAAASGGVAAMMPRQGAVRLLIASELLMKHETVTHRSAGHVWARLLGTTRVGTGGERDGAGGNEIAQAFDQMLTGRWAKTAKDEVGSLIVQSVLENWTDVQKSSVVDELLADLKACAIQPWGNFVVLYLIEHSSGPVRAQVFEKMFFDTRFACEVSTDNYGAKAMEKAIKVAGMEGREVEAYVKAICEYGHGRPAIIDIACHVAGAQVLTLLFTSAPNHLKEPMIQAVRRHGVTLKSSKAGSKIWYLVERTRAWVGH